MSHSVFSANVTSPNPFKSPNWIIDTSATDHMVHSLSLLTTITSTLHRFVYLPNGDKALVTHIGIVQILETFTLHGVLCVPSFSFNLISITQLTRVVFCCLIFLGSFCFIQDLVHWNTIGLGKEFFTCCSLLQLFLQLILSLVLHQVLLFLLLVIISNYGIFV